MNNVYAANVGECDSPPAAYIYAQIHQGHLIGIVKDETGFTFDIFLPGSVEAAETQYSDVAAALNAAIKQIERNFRWRCGFQAYEQGEPLPEIADPDFINGWHEGQQAYGRAA